MIPHYSRYYQLCERCERDILYGEEFILDEDGYFCTEECLIEHVMAGRLYKKAYLTKDRIWREID